LATFLALYRGESVSAAKLLALTAEPAVVRDFASRLLEEPSQEPDPDPIIEELERGRRHALRLVTSEAD
jgi:hypothetical protein